MPDTILQPAGTSDGNIRDFILSSQPIDAASWLIGLPLSETWRHLEGLEPSKQAALFEKFPLNAQVDLAGEMPPRNLARIVARMDADDRTDLYNRLPVERQNRLIGDLDKKDRDDIRRLSAHAEECAGAIMTSDFATLNADMTAAQAIEALKAQATGKETIYRSYILDRDRRLIGSVELHKLILAPHDTPVGALMDPAPVSVTLDTDQEDVGKLIARYDLLAIPVVDSTDRLAGIVTHDDALDVMQAEATEDFQKLSTVQPFTENLREAGARILYSKRIGWLAILVLGNLFSGAGIAYFEDLILAYVSLVFFLPLLIDSSGNAGSQSATLMVRALATGDVEMKDWFDLILREIAVAAMLGATMAAVVLPVGAWRGGPEVALTVGLTMFVVVMIGSLVGMSLPFLLSRLRLDPATASGPLVTTISDATGVLIYFAIATIVLGL